MNNLLHRNKNVNIIKGQNNGYYVMCTRSEVTPGAYMMFDVEKDIWYDMSISYRKAGSGITGLWIADKNKKTLFFGNFQKKNKSVHIKRKFFSGDLNQIIIGVLVKNANKNCGFYLENISIEKHIKEEEDLLKKETNKELEELDNFVNEDNNLTDEEGSLTDEFSESEDEEIIYSVSLGIPEGFILDNPKKEYDFFPQQIGQDILSLKNLDTKLEKSRFIVLNKDNILPYYALSKGCIPIGLDTDNKLYPKKEINDYLSTNNIFVTGINKKSNYLEEYNNFISSMISYSKNFLTTKKIAESFIKSLKVNDVSRILMLSVNKEHNKFMNQLSLLYGLRELYSDTNVIDYPKIRNLDKKECFPYGKILHKHNSSRGRMENRIKKKEFSIIIIFNKEDYLYKSTIEETYEEDSRKNIN